MLASCVEKYLLDKYPGAESILTANTKMINKINPLVQRDYGEDMDCTLTSITTCINYYLQGKATPGTIYLEVEKNGLKYFYNGKTYGTIPLFIKNIYDKSLKKFKVNYKSKYKMIKGIGYNLFDIKKAINEDKPVILSIYKDSVNKYNNHTITVVGYTDYTLSNGTKTTLLNCYDNWSKVVSLVDLDGISRISMINF